MSKIVYIGNSTQALKTLYNDLVAKKYNYSITTGCIDPDNKIQKLSKKHLIRSKIKYKQANDSSIFFFHRYNDGMNWHWDGNGDGDRAMIIAAYPYPTQILLDGQFSGRNGAAFEKYNVKGEIFTPNIGDIYYLGPGTIHRTNPKAIGGPHLVIRTWLWI